MTAWGLASLCHQAVASPHDVPGQTSLDAIEAKLQAGAVQEKVYLHLDNNCYFVGDTIWYKAYVVRADDLRYTDMSRLVHVELVTPEGMVVERQQLIATEQGMGDGCFAIRDSLYAGYYELRAYTRWMLNFGVTEHPNRRQDREPFYNSDVARDFYREYGTIHSRVVPIYDRPDQAGEYDLRFMTRRKKMREPAQKKEQLQVTFYPEGGQLVAGTRCRVAFEAIDHEGQSVDVKGTISTGQLTAELQTAGMGRGIVELDVPQQGQMTAKISYGTKDYTYALPQAEKAGCALRVSQDDEALTADIGLAGMDQAQTYALAILCRGRLQAFERFCPAQTRQIRIDKSRLTTGVNDILVLSPQGRPLADRLAFVNKHDYDATEVSLKGKCTDLEPLQAVTLQVEAPADAQHLSIAIRDSKTDERLYDTSTLLTDLLLGSELQGFVANPQYYFEQDSPERRRDLDLLMMVQGWRRYDYSDIVSAEPLRYTPEVCLTVEGDVYKTVDFIDAQTAYGMQQFSAATDTVTIDSDVESPAATTASSSDFLPNNYLGEHPRLKHEVTVVGELSLVDEVGEVELETTGQGHFAFNIPGFLGTARLFLSAHKTDASERKLHKQQVKDRLNEQAWPNFYVKRHLFYPVFAKPYSYYQCHLPVIHETDEDDDRYWWLLPGQEMVRISSMDTRLEEVEVRAQRHRGSRAVDLDQPLVTMDAYDIYNLVTDYGLSYGKFNYTRFAQDITRVLFGSYDNTGVSPRVQTRMGDDLNQDNFNPNDPLHIETDKMSDYALTNNMQLKRIDSVQVFTDFDLRQYDNYLERNGRDWDVLVRYIMMPGQSERYTYRDRRIDLTGIYLPAEYYRPDYSLRPLPEGQKDYRRTLYWDANARLDAEGRCSVTFYNNSTARAVRVSIAGITSDGKPVVLEQ